MQWPRNAMIVKRNLQLSEDVITVEFVAKYFAQNVVEITFRVKTLAVKVNNRILFDLDNS